MARMIGSFATVLHSNAIKRRLTVLALAVSMAVLAIVGSSPNGERTLAGPSIPDLTGSWSVVAPITSDGTTYCQVFVTQSGAALSGTIQCTFPGPAGVGTLTGTVSTATAASITTVFPSTYSVTWTGTINSLTNITGTWVGAPFSGTFTSTKQPTQFTDAVDISPGDGYCDIDVAPPINCTLRALIQETNALAGPQTIAPPAGTYTLTIAGTGENAAATGDLDIIGALTINGAGAGVTIINGGALDGVLDNRVGVGVTTTISGVTITNGQAPLAGGGISNLFGFGTLTLANSAVSGNTSGGAGGGIATNGTAGIVNIVNSTISGNVAFSSGGGIDVSAAPPLFGGILTLTNSTVSGNTSSAAGGGISFLSPGSLLSSNSTIAFNTAANLGGGIAQVGSGTATLRNTILADNVDSSTVAPDCSGAIGSQGYNLIGKNTGCTFAATTGDQVGTGITPINPQLGGLVSQGRLATTANLNLPSGVAVDAGSKLFIPEFANCRVRRVSAAGIIATVAGTGVCGYNGDGIAATTAQLSGPEDVAVDTSGNLFIADYSNCRVRKVSAGIITTVAGTGVCGYNGDSIAATAAQLNFPEDVGVDATGNLFIADFTNCRVRKVTAGIITTVAGTGVCGYNGDGIAATTAQLNGPVGAVVDTSGNLFIVDYTNCRVRKVSGGIITTVAGTGVCGYNGDSIAATGANLNGPAGVAVESSGNLFIADRNNCRVRKVSAGIITTIAGTGVCGYTSDGGPATTARLNTPGEVDVDASGNVYIADTYNCRVRKVSAGIITTVAGIGICGYNGDTTSTPAHGIPINSPAVDKGNPATPGSGGSACEAADQRGRTRLTDGDADAIARCDIGAYEFEGSSPCPNVPDLILPFAGCSRFAFNGSVIIDASTIGLINADCPLSGEVEFSRSAVGNADFDALDDIQITIFFLSGYTPCPTNIGSLAPSGGTIEEQTNSLSGTLEFPATAIVSLCLRAETTTTLGTIETCPPSGPSDPLELNCKLTTISSGACLIGSSTFYDENGQPKATAHGAPEGKYINLRLPGPIRPPLGGVAEVPRVRSSEALRQQSPEANIGLLAGLAAALAGGAGLAAGAFYVRRRLRRG